MGITRLGSSLALLDAVHLGSDMSVRSFSRVGSALALFGALRVGACLSLLDFTRFGASLALRSFVRFGSSMSIVGNLKLGSDIKGLDTIRGYTSANSVSRRLSLPAGSNAVLHGQWFADVDLDTSDRRHKLNVASLERHLQKRRDQIRGTSSDASGSEESAVAWVLRELRPVSFRFKSGTDTKALPAEQRFGFVAQEVERVTPDLVRGSKGILPEEGKGDGSLALIYKDLVAVLALAFKEQQEQLGRESLDVTQAKEEVSELLEAAEQLESVLDKVEASGLSRTTW